MQDSVFKKYQDKKILIVGLGLQGSGIGLVKFFSKITKNLRVTDLKTIDQLKESLEKVKDINCEFTLGEHREEDFLWADVIIKGPSVPWESKFIQLAQINNKEITTEINLFFQYCQAKIIGITGTRGKSTTTTFIFKLIDSYIQSGADFLFKKVYLAGNISGISTISLLENTTKDDLVVLELSSWQLSGLDKIQKSPWISVFTNFYPDHLNYYKNLEEYFLDKSKIYLYQKENDYLVANINLENKISNLGLKQKIAYFDKTKKPDISYLAGIHNIENINAAIEVLNILKIDKDFIVKNLKNISGLPYRVEKIAVINNIDIINDTTSTTPIACEFAIKTFPDKEITLILGGNSKNLPLKDLAQNINEKVKSIVLLKGTFTSEILPFLDNKKIVSSEIEDLKEAFDIAFKNTSPGGVILFSPAATSFACFKNEFHRGEEFSRIVLQYASHEKKY